MSARFTFGKYRGRDIEEIRFKDPQYCRWAADNVAGFAVILEAAVSAATKPHKRRRKGKVDIMPPKAYSRPPQREWGDYRPNPVLDAILADYTLAFTHPRERHMAPFEPDTFAPGDEPPY